MAEYDPGLARPLLEHSTSSSDSMDQFEALKEHAGYFNHEEFDTIPKWPSVGQSSRRKKFILMWSLFSGLLLISAAIYTLLPFTINPTPKFHSVFGGCGNTSEQARARGCIYDFLASHWLQPECAQPHLIDQYRGMTDALDFYSNTSMEVSSQLRLADVEDGQYGVVWAPYKFHAVRSSLLVLGYPPKLMRNRYIARTL